MRRLATLLLLCSCCTSLRAQVQSIELGTFGEVTTWLVGYLPHGPMAKDPLEAIGGEERFAAMSEPKLLPVGGRSIELPGPNPKEKVRLLWQIARMVPPEHPNIWTRYLRLNLFLDKSGRVTGGNAYLYCRLVSPMDMPGGLIVGAGASQRFYLNGKELKKADRPSWGEDSQELPIALRKGVNHLLVRIQSHGVAALHCRLVGPCAEPLQAVKVQFDAAGNTPVAPGVVCADIPSLEKLAANLRSLPPPEHPEVFGAKIQRTMSLLEAGKYTHRPVRIMFYGQSIEGWWTELLVARLRERYPETAIVYDNRAIGGWFVWRLQKTLKHDILRWQPDLVLFSAYQGTAEVWERFLSDLRRETTADIIIRTSHLGRHDAVDGPADTAETITLRHLAQKYDVELIELRAEWMDYLKTQQLPVLELLRDGVHLNRKGDILMAMLYERHFRYNAAACHGWANTVRRFDAMRFFEDRKADEIVLSGPGWKRTGRGFAESASPQDALKLKFVGSRVDLVLPTGRGGAAIRIDGKRPSELGLFHGTKPWARTRDHYSYLPNDLMAYHLGANAQAETWCMTYTHASSDKVHVRFRLTGSKTGPDGEGESDRDFVSSSGRIAILADDWGATVQSVRRQAAEPRVLEPLPKQAQLIWHVLPDGMDTVHGDPTWRRENDYYVGQPYTYVTIADGLPCGPHELTLTPLGEKPSEPFVILGIDVHRPPMARWESPSPSGRGPG
jgi:hypothetical protein